MLAKHLHARPEESESTLHETIAGQGLKHCAKTLYKTNIPQIYSLESIIHLHQLI